jgi:carboxypeptidase family protein
MKRLGTALVFGLTVVAATPVRGSDGVVLGIRSEGVVIDISALQGVQPGGRVGFLRPDAQRTPTGRGFVLDVQGGQALVGIVPGGSVQVNDLVVLCPSRDSGEGDQIRALVDGIRAQAASPQVLATAGRLQSVLDARDAALQQGSCDVARFDQEAQGLLAQLQSEVAAMPPASPTATGYPAPVSSPPPGGYSPPGTTYPPPASTSGSPTPGTPDPTATAQPGYAGGATASPGQPGDAIDSASRGADVLAKLALIAQSLGLAGGGTQAGSAPMGGGGLPQGTGYPPPGGSAPATGGYPPAGGGIPPAGGGYPTPGGSAPASGSYPPVGGSTPTTGGYPPPGGSAPVGGAYPPTGGGYVPPTAGGTQSATKPTWTLNQIPRAPIVAIQKGTVTGRVQTQTGQPLAAAQITVGDAKGQTNAQGQFSVAGLVPGQYTVTVSAIGYLKQTRTVTLEPGETEKLVVVMPRLMMPIKPAPKTP